MRVAILEDDETSLAHLMRVVTEARHSASGFPTVDAMFRSLRRESFDLLLLDWVLPESSGLAVLTWVKENLNPSPPVIMVTGRVSERDIIAGLNRGADDYVSKPIKEEVLKARVDAVLRRTYGAHARGSQSGASVETFDEYAFDLEKRTVTIDGEPVVVTQREFSLALLLFRNLQRPLSRAHIVEEAWGEELDPMSRTLDAHVWRVRRRLKLNPERGWQLSSVYSFGYRLDRVDPPT